MSDLILSEQHSHAVELHQKIMTSAALAQQNLWDMCTSLKEMRDDKLYKELGYSNFEDYCENEVGFSREQGRKYISIIENVNPENANSSWHLGVTKLYLLSTISESDQQEITEKVNLEETTVKELKAEIDKLKADKKNLEIEKSDIFRDKCRAEQDAERETRNNQNLKNKLDEANTYISELENRPTEVAVVDHSAENERKLNEVIRSLERENIKRNEELDRQYIEDRRKLEADKQREIIALREEYEKKLADASTAEASQSPPVDESKVKFKVYLTAAFDALKRLTDFSAVHTDAIYKEKTKQLLTSVLSELEE